MLKNAKVVMLPIKSVQNSYDFIDAPFCINKDGVFNIVNDEEDAFKSYQWFSNWPYHLYFIDFESKFEVGNDNISIEFDSYYPAHSKYIQKFGKGPFKILATTDRDNLKYVPKIPQSFIDAFIKEKGQIDSVNLSIIRNDKFWLKLNTRADGTVIVHKEREMVKVDKELYDDFVNAAAELRSLKQSILEGPLTKYFPKRENISFHDKIVFAIDDACTKKDLLNSQDFYDLMSCYRIADPQIRKES